MSNSGYGVQLPLILDPIIIDSVEAHSVEIDEIFYQSDFLREINYVKFRASKIPSYLLTKLISRKMLVVQKNS